MARDTIDPHLGIIRVDDTQGKPIATLWNFAMCAHLADIYLLLCFG